MISDRADNKILLLNTLMSQLMRDHVLKFSLKQQDARFWFNYHEEMFT